MTAIKDLISLPEHVHRGDFVLRLTEGVEKPAETLRDYVVTPQLVECFDAALRFIKGAVDAKSSKAAYLHGSFGSGKSHFMAVLHLLLGNDAGARGIPELASVVARHTAWTESRRFLLVPYHMIGAQSMESAILGHYVEHVRRLHPDAPLPGVFKAEGLFADADRLRTQMGDEAFLSSAQRESIRRQRLGHAGREGLPVDPYVLTFRVTNGQNARATVVSSIVPASQASTGVLPETFGILVI